MARNILAITLCLFLGGCASISMNAEDLLVPPPKPEADHVEEALQATVSPSDILYQYPQRGDYRPCFLDMDNDGRRKPLFFTPTA